MSVRGVTVFRRAALMGVLAVSAHPLPASAAPAPEALEHFEKKIRPVLVNHCYKCHSAQAAKKKGGLHLDSREAILTGGDSGPALVAASGRDAR